MRIYFGLLVLICGISFSGTVMADGGLYGGIGLGEASVEIESGVLNDGSNIYAVNKDETGTSKSFFIGFELNDNISIEVGKIDFGESSVSGLSDGTGSFWFAGPVEIQFEATTIFLDIIGKHEINDRFDLFAKAGYYDADLDVALTDSWGTVKISESNTGLLFGLGISYSFNEKLSGRASWTKFKDVGDDDTIGESDVDNLGLDLVFSFN